MKKTFFSLIVLVMTLLISCTKPGPVEPQGPAGINGTNGKDGAAGTNGTNGTNGVDGTNGTNGVNGNANVIGTNTVALNSGSWTASGSYFLATFSTTAITQAIVDKGAVMVYEQSATFWRALPYTSAIVSKFFFFTLNSVSVVYQNTDGSQTTNPGNQTYRIVAISASAKTAYPNINWGNYEEVRELIK
jgi:hypothetical protein